MVQAGTWIAVTVGVCATGVIAYAIYFDHRRRTDPAFRKQLRKESKRQARAARDEAELDKLHQRAAIKAAIEQAKVEGFPAGVEDKEQYFMQELAKGEDMSQQAGSDDIETALCFFKALKVYPRPEDLVTIYDKTVPKHVLDILAEMIAADPELNKASISGGLSDDGIPHVGLD